MLDPEMWGRGYATEAGGTALVHAFESLGVERVVSLVHLQNDRSFAVAHRLAIEPWREVPWDDRGIVLQVLAIGRADWSRLRRHDVEAK